MAKFLLGIDQGTSSTRSVIFNAQAEVVAAEQQEYDQLFPHEGWVEQNPEDIWQTVLSTGQAVLAKANLTASDIAGIGISNQRETTLVWDKKTGQPIHNAIGWQDSRTAELCQQHTSTAVNEMLRDKTGLLLNPYFSATKLAWILDNVPNARERAAAGELLFGTVDSFLLWRLTGGVHKTDATNASRTLLFNIREQQWDNELLEFFNIPEKMLPTVCDNSSDFGQTQAEHYGAPITVAGMVGDQQAALIGQTCFAEGMVKTTYGTGAFVVVNTGDKLVDTQGKLLATMAYRLGGKATYALEGSVFTAGAAVKWLRDKLHLIESASEIENLMQQARSDSQVFLIPSFAGTAAPYWLPETRAAFVGMTLDTGIAELVKATVDANAYRTRDILEAAEAFNVSINTMRIDGGMSVNKSFCQFLSDVLKTNIERPNNTETSVLGAVYLAGLQVGMFDSLTTLSQMGISGDNYQPQMSSEVADSLYSQWQTALGKVINRL